MLDRENTGNPKLLNPLTLAFVGDAVFGLLVRERLAGLDLAAGRLHPVSVGLVRAEAQAKAVELLLPRLSDEETAVYKRGRNAHAGNVPKNATVQEYHAATGLEALFGFLYLAGRTQRIQELFDKIWDASDMEKERRQLSKGN
ncbi:MAG: ribonuclease III [Clostridiales bacterium]|nr:ribonuclease III [Clostridiales bacterium]